MTPHQYQRLRAIIKNNQPAPVTQGGLGGMFQALGDLCTYQSAKRRYAEALCDLYLSQPPQASARRRLFKRGGVVACIEERRLTALRRMGE